MTRNADPAPGTDLGADPPWRTEFEVGPHLSTRFRKAVSPRIRYIDVLAAVAVTLFYKRQSRLQETRFPLADWWIAADPTSHEEMHDLIDHDLDRKMTR